MMPAAHITCPTRDPSPAQVVAKPWRPRRIWRRAETGPALSGALHTHTWAATHNEGARLRSSSLIETDYRVDGP